MKKLLTVIASALVLVGTAEAALVDRGGGMIYDTTLNITWLSDWNYAKTSGFDTDGLMDWDTANVWAENLVYGGYSDWRLPVADSSGGGRGAGSELGHMYMVNAGATYPNDILSGSNTENLALLENMQSYYWTGTEIGTGSAWFFAVSEGTQAGNSKLDLLSAVAVRSGDVAAVPEPTTIALATWALLGIAATRKRRPAPTA